MVPGGGVSVGVCVCVWCMHIWCFAMHFRSIFLFTLKVGIDAVPLFVVPFLLLLFSHCPHTHTHLHKPT